MRIIPSKYFTEEVEVKLTQPEIQAIIDELERTEHNIFTYLNYDKIIRKLRKGLKNG